VQEEAGNWFASPPRAGRSVAIASSRFMSLDQVLALPRAQEALSRASCRALQVVDEISAHARSHVRAPRRRATSLRDPPTRGPCRQLMEAAHCAGLPFFDRRMSHWARSGWPLIFQQLGVWQSRCVGGASNALPAKRQCSLAASGCRPRTQDLDVRNACGCGR